jgi:hypothetical protein
LCRGAEAVFIAESPWCEWSVQRGDGPPAHLGGEERTTEVEPKKCGRIPLRLATLPDAERGRSHGDDEKIPAHGARRDEVQNPRQAPEREEVDRIEPEPPLAELDVAEDLGPVGRAHRVFSRFSMNVRARWTRWTAV